ncbi:MAG: hypothetical protein MI919_14520, partial [Holophagales bacterium]|nr:hypothetical protein [Holophagales bacterium]
EPCIEVFRPDGSLHSSFCEPNNPRLDLTLDQTGSFVVLVSDDNDDETFSYNLAFEGIVPLSCASAQIQYGQQLSGEINPIGELDTFAAAGAAGDQLTVTATGTSGSGDPCLEAFGPTGLLIGSDCDGSTSLLSLLLTEDGPQTILLSEDNDDETFGYELLVECLGQCPTELASCGLIFEDGFESGNVVAWGSSAP